VSADILSLLHVDSVRFRSADGHQIQSTAKKKKARIHFEDARL